MKYFIPVTLVGVVAGAPLPQKSGGSGSIAETMGPAQTGVFGAGPQGGAGNMNLGSLAGMAGSVIGMTKDTTGGSGPYKASIGPVPGLTRHTLYMPKSVPEGITLPAIVWGNGACSGNGVWFSKFLAEIASHGFIIVANGAPGGSMSDKTKATDLPKAIDWIYENAGKGDFTNVDKTKLAAAGQSCGGIQAYSASLDPRVKLTGIFNSGLLNPDNTKLFDQLHAPIGFFLGGSTDIAFANGERDFKNMPTKIPVTKANLPVGHMATYGEQHGGKFGKAAVAFFLWHLKGDEAAGKQFLDPTSSPLTKAGWKIEVRNYNASVAA